MLSDTRRWRRTDRVLRRRLNAPYGARCFLTAGEKVLVKGMKSKSLNAPYGARCFLTREGPRHGPCAPDVLMRLMALGAF